RIDRPERALLVAAHGVRAAAIEVAERRQRGRITERLAVSDVTADLEAPGARHPHVFLEVERRDVILDLAARRRGVQDLAEARARGREQEGVARVVAPAERQLQAL